MLTDEQLTYLYNDDGPLDQQRVERIKQLKAENAALRAEMAKVEQRDYRLLREDWPTSAITRLEAENAAMRKIVEWIASELPDYHTIVAIRKEARALLAADEHDGVQ